MEKPIIIELHDSIDRGILADPRARAAVKDLPNHLGFQYLTAKLRFVRAALRNRLEVDSQERMRDVDYLKLGIEWSKWFEKEIMAATPPPAVRTTEASDEEAELFDKIRSSYISVGSST